ncbi:MAG: hypothetical protein AABY22_32985 [Nanoarchaeota archaeon]
MIISWLKNKFGVIFRLNKNNSIKSIYKYSLGMTRENTKKFIDLIKPFVPECMNYKLGLDREKRKNAQKQNEDYYLKNKDGIKERTTLYYRLNKEKVKLYNKRYYENNKERISKRKNKYYLRNREKSLLQMRIYFRILNKGKISLQKQIYYLDNREKILHKKRRKNDIKHKIVE